MRQGNYITVFAMAICCVGMMHPVIDAHALELQAKDNGKPFLRHYTQGEYNGSDQNWSITRDNRGVMYFGNNFGILEYDGVAWRLISLPIRSSVRSLAIDSSGTVYAGTMGEFGYLAPDSQGKMQYVSLSSKLEEKEKNFKRVRDIHVTPEGIYFRSFAGLFRYHKEKLKIWRPDDEYRSSFKVQDDLYILESGKGLLKMVGDSLQLIEGSDFFANTYIRAMLPYGENQILLGTLRQGLFLFNKDTHQVTKFFAQDGVDEFVKTSLTCGIALPGERFAFSVYREGVMVISKKGEILNSFNAQIGLQDESAAKLFYDKQTRGLWLALSDGIAIVEIDTPIRKWDRSSGMEGGIRDIIVHSADKNKPGVIYVATNSGVYFLDRGFFRKIATIEDQTWSFLAYTPPRDGNPLLLAAGSDGVYQINRNKAVLIKEVSARILHRSQKNPERLYIGSQTGLSSLQYENDQWVDNGEIEGFTKHIDNLGEDEEGNLWIGERYGTVSKLQGQEITRYDASSGLPHLDHIFFAFLKNEIIFRTKQGHYRFDKLSQQFVPENRFGSNFNLVEDVHGNIWRIGNNFNLEEAHGNIWRRGSGVQKAFEVLFKQTDGTYKKDSISLKRLSHIPSINRVFPQESGITWIGANKVLFRYDSNPDIDYQKPPHTLIRRVTVAKDSTIFFGTEVKKNRRQIPVLPYKNNTLQFEFAAAYFIQPDATQFSHLLEGYDDTWSTWRPETQSQYTNLPEGCYAFKVKAKNIYGVESITAKYRFDILPPWYRTFSAYGGYGILFVLILYVGIRINTRRIRAANLRLEDIVQKRTLEISEQRDHIAEQNEHILSSIEYAERIQQAILPLDEKIKSALPNHFIIYKPKDIVSGDFYWFNQIDDQILLAIVDCTGHGVPGAFMSMIGNTILNETVKEKKITDPALILEHLHMEVRYALKQDAHIHYAQDGMDVCLCCFQPKNKKIIFAGAKRSLFLVKNDKTAPGGGELIEIKGDRTSIGGRQKEERRTFTNREIDIQSGDMIYLTSDGFVDQGDPQGKRYGSKRMRLILESIASPNMKEQKDKLLQELTNYQGDAAQRDDITLIGVRGLF
jgi:serine phosphatase RsbU (regulator of sigma subunit)